jgi:cellulose synthase/poly-beta-1,6-N-acetylglucosamine synthase-like glycosyltransferase
VTTKALSSQPQVAVCIPAHGSSRGLHRLLASLDRVDYPSTSLHLIVCIDGPDDVLAEVARAAGATVVVLPVNGGSYAARNAAIDAVAPSAEIVLFTDTDCAVTPGWIRAHVTALADADASGGAVRITTAARPRPAEWVDASRHLRQQHFVETLGFAATCNLAVRRRVLDDARFDATLRSGGDFDFGQRLRAAGNTLVYTPDAAVEHPARESAAAVLRKVARVAQGAAVNEKRGYQAAQRRDPARVPALRRADVEGVVGGFGWRTQVRLLDAACSAVYARHVPEVVLPALRRRLTGRRLGGRP